MIAVFWNHPSQLLSYNLSVVGGALESFVIEKEENMGYRYSYEFDSRRSVVMSREGMVATSHPLAVQAGLDVLKDGGNAIDAAIAAAAVLTVVEPASTGIGGDVFALVYASQTRQLRGLNASGRAPAAATIEEYRKRGYSSVPQDGILSVTVPGALSGWAMLLEAHGSMDLKDLLAPAIVYAKEGFPVTETISREWHTQERKLQRHGSDEYLVRNRAPSPGQMFRQPNLARTLEEIALDGEETFYRGDIAHKIARASERRRGLLALEDLKSYEPVWVDPISTSYRGYTAFELPPNTQGLVALQALNIVEGYDLCSIPQGSCEYYHLLIEATKLAFADAESYVCDPDFCDISLSRLLSKEYAAERRKLIGDTAEPEAEAGTLSEDTVYLAVVDSAGNVVSFINSLFHRFGSGVVVGDTGIVLHNRGCLFSLDPNHPNCLQPGKRPFHTLIPGMVFHESKPFMSFGVTGGSMQPQGHLQVLCGILDYGLNPQEALNMPRFRFYERNEVSLEQNVDLQVKKALVAKGHRLISTEWNEFGGGQVILMDPDTRSLLGASDPRKDGCAQGY